VVPDRVIGSARLQERLGDWRGPDAAYSELAEALRQAILDGVLPLRTRLPAERAVAAQLGVGRITVSAAYRRLRDEGYLQSRQGSGSWTTMPAAVQASTDAFAPAGTIDLTIAALTAPPELPAAAEKATRRLASWLDHHGYAPLGIPVLREAVARRFSLRGLPTRPEQILVTGGALPALDLVVRALSRRGDKVVVETPTYPGAIGLLERWGCRLSPITVSESGWDLSEAVSTFDRTRPRLAYVIPDFHNPTGNLASEIARSTLLGAAGKVGALVIVDETNVELNLGTGSLPAPMAALGPDVITLGSASKSFWGGLRIGWVRADPEMIHDLAKSRAQQDLSSPILDQLILTELLIEADSVLDGRRRLALQRRDTLGDTLTSRLPQWQFRLPDGGLCVWARLPKACSTRLARRADDEGLLITPGPRFSPDGQMDNRLRLPYTLNPEVITDAVTRLGSIYASLDAGAGPSPMQPSKIGSYVA
jgi:DNA-binding transcriptional MocR family regulator